MTTQSETRITFKDRALPMLARGIAVMPLKPQTKEAFIPDFPKVAFLADRKQVLTSDQENPDYNVGCVAGLCCYIDDDCGGAMGDMILKDTGINIRKMTYTVRTYKGYHSYFKSTVESKLLGNCKKAGVFDFQSFDKYVVGPLSVHPNGTVYEPVDPNAPIREIPKEIVEWLDQHKDQKAGNGHAQEHERPLSDKFDVEAFIEHYELVGHWEEDKFILDECPFAGRYHTDGHGKRDPKATCLMVGDGFGFSCFAASCEGCGAGIGKLIKKLNEDHEPYRGEIWEPIPVDDLLDTFGAVEDLIEQGHDSIPIETSPEAPAAVVGEAARERSEGREEGKQRSQ